MRAAVTRMLIWMTLLATAAACGREPQVAQGASPRPRRNDALPARRGALRDEDDGLAGVLALVGLTAIYGNPLPARVQERIAAAASSASHFCGRGRNHLAAHMQWRG